MTKEKLSLAEVQQVELNILLYLDQVCKENNIKYNLSSGTLLGAIKYQNFIPWDDDIDVILFRDEYQKLMKVLKHSQGRYKLLSIYNTRDYYYPFAKLVDTKTVLKENAKQIKDLGVYIDIVPMDGYRDEFYLKQIDKDRFIKNMMIGRFQIKNCIRYNFDYIKGHQKQTKNKKFKDFVYHCVDLLSRPLGYRFWVKLYDRKISKVKLADAKYLGVRTGSFDVKEVFKKEDLIKQADYEFAGHKFPSFQNYDLYLRSKFGDYKKEPKKEQQKSHHQFEAYWK